MNSFQFRPVIHIKMDEFNAGAGRLAEGIRKKIEEVGACNISARHLARYSTSHERSRR